MLCFYRHFLPFLINKQIKMPRRIYLAVFSNGARPAHQSLFIPTGDSGDSGKIIHVTGNPATGFFLEFKRNYDFSLTQRTFQRFLLGTVKDRYVTDTVGDGTSSQDTIARDRLESAATTVPPPGRSPNPFDPLVRSSLEGYL
jgi:hypothetical protein